MKYKVTSDSVLFNEQYVVGSFDNIFEDTIEIVFFNMNKNNIPTSSIRTIKNGTDKIVFTYTYPINSDTVSIVFNIEKID